MTMRGLVGVGWLCEALVGEPSVVVVVMGALATCRAGVYSPFDN